MAFHGLLTGKGTGGRGGGNEGKEGRFLLICYGKDYLLPLHTDQLFLRIYFLLMYTITQNHGHVTSLSQSVRSSVVTFPGTVSITASLPHEFLSALGLLFFLLCLLGNVMHVSPSLPYLS